MILDLLKRARALAGRDTLIVGAKETSAGTEDTVIRIFTGTLWLGFRAAHTLIAAVVLATSITSTWLQDTLTRTGTLAGRGLGGALFALFTALVIGTGFKGPWLIDTVRWIFTSTLGHRWVTLENILCVDTDMAQLLSQKDWELCLIDLAS